MDKPGAWLRRVTINAAISWHRSNRREQAARSRLQPSATSGAVEVESQQFWTAVRALPERQRAAIALYYLEDLSIADVARDARGHRRHRQGEPVPGESVAGQEPRRVARRERVMDELDDIARRSSDVVNAQAAQVGAHGRVVAGGALRRTHCAAFVVAPEAGG